MSNGGTNITVSDSVELQRFQSDVREAIELLDFAIKDGRNVPDSIIERTTKAENYLAATQWPSDDQRTEFEKAYRDLAMFMKPVTIATLRATTDPPIKSGSFGKRLLDHVTLRTNSAARKYSKKFWLFIIICASAIITQQALQTAYPDPAQNSTTQPSATTPTPSVPPLIKILKPILLHLTPFLYGWLGALVFLLRSAHVYIADNTFDEKRVPEYYNRMLLGFVGGGAVMLFTNSLSDPQGKAKAASFIVGYNTDYLFQTLERVASAIFPKDKGDQVAKPGIGSVAIESSSKEIAPGKSGNAAVTLNVPAPAGGVAVTLASDDAIKTPPSLTISDGKTSAQFTFTVTTDAKEGAAVITATAPDGSSASGSVQVKK